MPWVGIEPAFPGLHVRCANHCTITTTLLETEQSERWFVSRGAPRRFYHSGTGLHRIIRRRFTGYQKYLIMFRMKNWKSNDVVTSQYEILTDPFWMKKHICREWESNPRSLDYMSGVLTTAPSRQPCWKQSNQRDDLLAAGLHRWISSLLHTHKTIIN